MKIYTAQELEDLCDHRKAEKLSGWQFCLAEVYSIGKYMRKYAYYPQNLPLYVHTAHGMDGIGPTPAYIFPGFYHLIKLFHSKNAIDSFKARYKGSCYRLFSPQIFYRRSNNIQKSPDAKGTIAFVAHSAGILNLEFDRIDYINQLKALPEEFQPVSICLHCSDITNQEYKIYMEHGFNVYTAGSPEDHRFIERFYDILKHFKYSTSNDIGSHLFYPVEMGIPFFIYGEKTDYVYSDSANKKGGFHFQDLGNYNEVYNLFKVPISDNGVQITKEQKKFVIEESGLEHGLSRWQMFFLLYWALITCCIRNILTNDIIKIFFKSAKYCIKNFLKPKQIKARPLLFDFKETITKILKGKKTYLYGAGLFAQKIIEKDILSELEISGIIDSNINKKGQKIGKYEVFHIDEIPDLNPDIIILCMAEPDLFYYYFLDWLFNKGLKITVIPDLFEEQRKEYLDIIEINNNAKSIGYDYGHLIF